jgi:hypothetical protein
MNRDAANLEVHATVVGLVSAADSLLYDQGRRLGGFLFGLALLVQTLVGLDGLPGGLGLSAALKEAG